MLSSGARARCQRLLHAAGHTAQKARSLLSPNATERSSHRPTGQPWSDALVRMKTLEELPARIHQAVVSEQMMESSS